MDNPKQNRINYVDNLKAFVIIVVVFIHADITYSGIGGWYYIENNYNLISSFDFVLFGFINSMAAAFLMALLFLFAGYFTPGSYDKKGFASFVSGRLFRLGIPVLLYYFIIEPVDFFILLPDASSNESFLSLYINYVYTLSFIYDSGPLWFALALLIFSIVYALFRLNLPFQIQFSPFAKSRPSLTIITLILLVTFLTYLVRLYYPIGTAVYNFQLCFFPQYIVIFIIGIISYRLNLFNKLSFRFGLTWMIAGLAISLLLFWVLARFGKAAAGNAELLLGGRHYQAFLYALWESVTCAAMVLGLIVLSRKYMNFKNRLMGFLSAHAFGVYVFQTPLLIFIALSFKPLSAGPIIKTLITGTLSLISAYFISWLVKKIKLMNQILS